MSDEPAKRLSLLYQLFVVNQAARRLTRSALAGTGTSPRVYALLSYLFANGPRTLTQASRDFGLPITTVATMMAPLVQRGDVVRSRHPTDRRARLLALSAAGRARVEVALPGFTAAHRSFLQRLQDAGVEPEGIFAALEEMRIGLIETATLMEAETAGISARRRKPASPRGITRGRSSHR
jgi:DNA-binding MarR family transcriptional regulator